MLQLRHGGALRAATAQDTRSRRCCLIALGHTSALCWMRRGAAALRLTAATDERGLLLLLRRPGRAAGPEGRLIGAAGRVLPKRCCCMLPVLALSAGRVAIVCSRLASVWIGTASDRRW